MLPAWRPHKRLPLSGFQANRDRGRHVDTIPSVSAEVKASGYGKSRQRHKRQPTQHPSQTPQATALFGISVPTPLARGRSLAGGVDDGLGPAVGRCQNWDHPVFGGEQRTAAAQVLGPLVDAHPLVQGPTRQPSDALVRPRRNPGTGTREEGGGPPEAPRGCKTAPRHPSSAAQVPSAARVRPFLDDAGFDPSIRAAASRKLGCRARHCSLCSSETQE
ncbi:hypothetical protein CMUS01_14797 [Colletotrichum musicola]|uniref:Uncharacterized protein n=1 Tax=Colletotrichum musicola TaxID=2175873 RepID=A0A8H6J1Y4_9PEZI|nr:hypothetical protein CMUS01_14797 [Colletotrichum musicola]